MLGEIPTFDYVLAVDMGIPLGEVRAMPYPDYVEMHAYYQYRQIMDDLSMRAGRTVG